MAEAMTSELRALSIPFFAIQRNLVQEKKDENQGDKGQCLTRDALIALQRRMLDLLQDLSRGNY